MITAQASLTIITTVFSHSQHSSYGISHTPSPCVTPGCFTPVSLTPLANERHLLPRAPHFRCNALWLSVFYDANPLFLMRISFLIYSCFTYAHFFMNVTRA